LTRPAHRLQSTLPPASSPSPSTDRRPGLTTFVDHDNQRIFHHTEVDDSHEGRGLATILVSEALQATRAAGQRIVAVCALVASYLDKHRDLDDIVDPVTDETEQFLRKTVHTG
jgi:predicted GNAT family acetyltransferase